MNLNGTLIILLIITLCGCSGVNKKGSDSISSEKESPNYIASSIVRASIEAHGGWEKWEDLAEISYTKTTVLFDSAGNQESKVIQTHNYMIKPSLEGNIQWMDGEDHVKILYTDGQGIKYVNEVAELDSESTESATGSFLSSYYVLFQPWKLLDEGTSLEFVGEDKLADGREVNVISPTYGERKEGDDQWWYYIDKETSLVAANMVDHSGRISLITNLKYDKNTDLIFNYQRKSHFVDKERNIKYLRAEYFYEDFQLRFRDQ